MSNKLVINSLYADVIDFSSEIEDVKKFKEKGIHSTDDFLNHLRIKFNEQYPKFNIEKVVIEDLIDSELNKFKYTGLIMDDEKNVVISYVFMMRPVFGSRNAFMAQQLFPGLSILISRNINSVSNNIVNKPIFLINSSLENITDFKKIMFKSVKIIGVNCVNLFNNGYDIDDDSVENVVNYVKDNTDDDFSDNDEYISTDYFDLNIKEKVLILKNDSLILENMNKFGNTDKFYVIKSLPASILAHKNGFRVDYSQIEYFIRNYSNGKNTFIPFLKYLKKISTNNSSEMQSVYFGSPGTGKSYYVSQLLRRKGISSDYIFRTTFHPEYTYSDFVGQLLPVVNNDNVTYRFIPGTFTNALKKAYEDTSKSVYLVIEEMSRGNVSSIFGDIFQLLDRNMDNESSYGIRNSSISKQIIQLSDDIIKLPANFHIISTVNTNDQNVFVMDNAFKRRFDWNYVSTTPKFDDDNVDINIVYGNEIISVSWHDLYQGLNDFITSKNNGMGLPEDKQIGQFFIKFDKSMDNYDIKHKICNKLYHYLWEDVESNAFSDLHLFDQKINNFSDLISKEDNNEQIFSDDFIMMLLGRTGKL